MTLNGPFTLSHVACFMYNRKKILRCNSFDIHVHCSYTKSFPYPYPCFIVQQDTEFGKTDVLTKTLYKKGNQGDIALAVNGLQKSEL